MISVLVYNRPEIALVGFVKYVESIMLASDWVSLKYNKDNIAHHPEVDIFNVIFKYLLHIEDAMFKGKISQTSRLAVNRVKLVQI